MSRSVRILTAIVILAAVGIAIRLAWVSDDAFISFRYARNLVQGAGMVFNPGERVEGYSNFLWTLLMALAMQFGADPVRASQVLGIACYAGTLVLLAWTGQRMARGGRAVAVVPVAAFAFAVHEHAQVFATGGLETPLITMLVTAVTVATIEARTVRGFAVAGFLAALAALTRPDGALCLLIPILGALPHLARARPLMLAACVAPMILMLAPYAVWKLAYYGDLLPNTYYAKNAGVSHIPQGLTYLRLYFGAYWILALGLVVPIVFLVARPGPKPPPDHVSPWRTARAPALLLAVSLLHLAYVTRVGGDFMFARFLLPVTPVLLIGAELLVLGLSSGLRWAYAAVVTAATFLGLVPQLIQDQFNPTGIVEERLVYPPHKVREAQRVGKTLREALTGTGARVAFYGSQAMLAYYGEFPVAIESSTGLTDREIARGPNIFERIGHEKTARLEYLQARGVDLVFRLAVRAGMKLNTIRIGDQEGIVLCYRREVMDLLKSRPGVEVTDIERFIDGEIRDLSRIAPGELSREYTWLKSYYFDHNDDPEREAPFRRALGLDPNRDRSENRP